MHCRTERLKNRAACSPRALQQSKPAAWPRCCRKLCRHRTPCCWNGAGPAPRTALAGASMHVPCAGSDGLCCVRNISAGATGIPACTQRWLSRPGKACPADRGVVRAQSRICRSCVGTCSSLADSIACRGCPHATCSGVQPPGQSVERCCSPGSSPATCPACHLLTTSTLLMQVSEGDQGLRGHQDRAGAVPFGRSAAAVSCCRPPAEQAHAGAEHVHLAPTAAAPPRLLPHECARWVLPAARACTGQLWMQGQCCCACVRRASPSLMLKHAVGLGVVHHCCYTAAGRVAAQADMLPQQACSLCCLTAGAWSHMQHALPSFDCHLNCMLQGFLHSHAPSSQLVTACSCAGAQPALAKLYRTIEVQVAHQAALSSLAGRLDLLCAQIPAASGKQDVVYQPQVWARLPQCTALAAHAGLGSLCTICGCAINKTSQLRLQHLPHVWALLRGVGKVSRPSSPGWAAAASCCLLATCLGPAVVPVSSHCSPSHPCRPGHLGDRP